MHNRIQRLLATAVCLVLFVGPIPAHAQSMERGFYGGAGGASSGTDRASESGGGGVFLGGITLQHSERVFLDLDVMYGKREFELAQGRLPFTGTDVSVSADFGVLLLTDRPVQPFLGAGLGFLHSSNQVRPEAAIPVPSLIDSATESAAGMFAQFGVGARIFATEGLFLQVDWMFRFRLADRLPERWEVVTLVMGYSF